MISMLNIKLHNGQHVYIRATSTSNRNFSFTASLFQMSSKRSTEPSKKQQLKKKKMEKLNICPFPDCQRDFTCSYSPKTHLLKLWHSGNETHPKDDDRWSQIEHDGRFDLNTRPGLNDVEQKLRKKSAKKYQINHRDEVAERRR